MKLFDVFFHPEREEQTQRAELVQAANLLQIGEFQLLQLAHKEWFGIDIPEARVDEVFARYMVSEDTPHWARHYAREILAMDDRGELDINDPSYHRFDRDYVTFVPKGQRQFVMAALFCGIVVFGGVALASLVARDPVSILPPYFERNELPNHR